MAEDDQNNDEYKFEEYDSMGAESMDEEHPDLKTPTPGPNEPQKDVRRNALIVIAIVIIFYVLYKFFGGLFSSKTEPVKPAIPPITQTAPAQPEVAPAAIPQPVQTVIKEQDLELKQKVSDIEANQQTIKSEVTTVSDQVGTVNNNVNNLNTEIAKLNQVIVELSNQVARQNSQISVLMAKAKPTKVRRAIRYPAYQNLEFNIQAVIPGRAWLIATNGSTLTVREGTRIQGYGVVKLIDSIQGRVLTSSGRVIRFSQEDS